MIKECILSPEHRKHCGETNHHGDYHWYNEPDTIMDEIELGIRTNEQLYVENELGIEYLLSLWTVGCY